MFGFEASFWIAWTAHEAENYISFTAAVLNDGYVAFGPSQTGGMKGGSMCVVREDPIGSGSIRIDSYHSADFVTPEASFAHLLVMRDSSMLLRENTVCHITCAKRGLS